MATVQSIFELGQRVESMTVTCLKLGYAPISMQHLSRDGVKVLLVVATGESADILEKAITTGTTPDPRCED